MNDNVQSQAFQLLVYLWFHLLPISYQQLWNLGLLSNHSYKVLMVKFRHISAFHTVLYRFIDGHKKGW